MLTIQHTQECLSVAYVHALAGRAGIKAVVGGGHDYGIDGYFREIRFSNGRRVESGVAIDFQLKASTDWFFDGSDVVYDLESKNFNDLVEREAGTAPFILILLCLPKSQEQWLLGSESEMTLRHCCYWYRPIGPATTNATTKRIRIPRENLLNVDAVRSIITEARVEMLGL